MQKLQIEQNDERNLYFWRFIDHQVDKKKMHTHLQNAVDICEEINEPKSLLRVHANYIFQ